MGFLGGSWLFGGSMFFLMFLLFGVDIDVCYII